MVEMRLMRPRDWEATAPRAGWGARRRGLAAIAAGVAVTLALAWLAVAAWAAAGSAAGPASVDAPTAGSVLAVSRGGSLAIGPESGGRDPGRPLPGSRRTAREPADSSGAFIYRKGRYRPLEGARGAAVTAHVGLNNRGGIVGSYPVDGSTLLRGFVRNGRGDYEGFDAAPGAPDRLTTPFDINDRGQVAGAYAVGSAAAPETAVFHGFVRSPGGAVTTVDVPGASITSLSGINNRGAVVGAYVDSRGRSHGLLLERGALTPIDPPKAANVYPGGANIQAFDINDHRQIVGFYPDREGTFHGFLYHKGKFTELDPPRAAGNRNGFGASAAFGINNRGQVVGQYVDREGVLHGYLWERKRGFRTIDPPAADSCGEVPNVGRVCGTVAADINDRGQILLPTPGGFFKGDGAG
jgi:probable HAF family extracellular repeat protein